MGNWYNKYLDRKLSKIAVREHFWGTSGSGVMFVCPEDGSAMLLLRSGEVEDPNTWGIPGGALAGTEGFHDVSDIKREETSLADLWMSAQKETREEIGYFPKNYKMVGQTVFRKGNFAYTTFIVAIPLTEKDIISMRSSLNWENVDLGWFNLHDLSEKEDLHFGVHHVLQNFDMNKINQEEMA